ncbi:hypothetical protein BDV93DRAFT_446968 [Ceratobasidium sp. AG-I]|nr:hypothetical protein BDV93DRAFT_446968 [Ceratobasidium sp. AG-I]
MLDGAGISLSQLLDNVLLGESEIRANKLVVKARTNIYTSGVLPRILSHIRKPPKMRVRGVAHKEARAQLEAWALETSKDILQLELVQFAKTTQALGTETEVVSEESLAGLTFDSILDEIFAHAPKLFEFLSNICKGPRQDRNKQKDAKFCVTIFINALAYQLSQYNNGMQKLLCIYFKAKDVPKSCYHLFQRCGIVYSYSWSVTALASISQAAMEKVAETFEDQPCIIIYDNIRLAFPVKHQRGDNLTVTDNGTAMTIIPMRDVLRSKSLLRNSDLWEQHRQQIISLYRSNRMPQFSAEDVFQLSGFLNERQRNISNVLDILFGIPLLKDSTKRTHALLVGLPPVHQLPYGKEHITRQFMLETVPMEEQSYVGNYAITKEILRQLGIDSDEKLFEWARLNEAACVGDSLTIQRVRMLMRMKAIDSSPLERMQHLIPVFGWLHLDMNLSNGIFYHHYAEGSTSGLARDAAALRRAGLGKPTKKRGPQYHTVDEFLQHTTTARFRELWLWATKCKDVDHLGKWVETSSPQQIKSAAVKIVDERASNRALEGISNDPNLCNSVTLSRDLLLRHEVWTSTRQGDVGRMENTLPSLLFFFLGAGATNYAREVAEVLHWRQHEAPPGVADLIRDECWVINTRGKADTFYPLDLRQELNNLSIKHGPPDQGCTWDAHRRWAPALPVLTSVVQHIDEHFHDFYRSRKHYVPNPEPDIRLLMARHAEMKIHEYEPNRPGSDRNNRTTNCAELGRVKVLERGYLEALGAERAQYMSYASSLQFAAHLDMSIEDAMKERAAAINYLDAPSNSNDALQTLIDTLLKDTEGDEDLQYSYNEPEEDEETSDVYEERRHRLRMHVDSQTG